MSIRLLLVDDHQMVRAGLRALLEDVEDIQIAGEAAGMAEARIESPDGAPVAEETVKAAAVALVEPALAAL